MADVYDDDDDMGEFYEWLNHDSDDDHSHTFGSNREEEVQLSEAEVSCAESEGSDDEADSVDAFSFVPVLENNEGDSGMLQNSSPGAETTLNQSKPSVTAICMQHALPVFVYCITALFMPLN